LPWLPIRQAREADALDDVDAIVSLIGDAPVVLLGEATHGTHEFYRLRANITHR
jgi:erythromycin esterase-like protein